MSKAEHGSRGKWAMRGVPHRGWTCVDEDDLGEPEKICEMCESAEIRYVHVMKHPDYQGSLAVGCICAGKMSEDYVGAKQRETRMKMTARRRHAWRNRVWRESAEGNAYINTDGFNIVVYERNNNWRIGVTNRETGQEKFGKRDFPDERAAKLAAFDALCWAKEKLNSE
jgi:hypothetical protein